MFSGEALSHNFEEIDGLSKAIKRNVADSSVIKFAVEVNRIPELLEIMLCTSQELPEILKFFVPFP